MLHTCNVLGKNRVQMIITVVTLVVDHLVNNAGIASVCWFEEVPDVADFKQVLVWFKQQIDCSVLSYFPRLNCRFIGNIAKLPLQMAFMYV